MVWLWFLVCCVNNRVFSSITSFYPNIVKKTQNIGHVYKLFNNKLYLQGAKKCRRGVWLPVRLLQKGSLQNLQWDQLKRDKMFGFVCTKHALHLPICIPDIKNSLSLNDRVSAFENTLSNMKITRTEKIDVVKNQICYIKNDIQSLKTDL